MFGAHGLWALSVFRPARKPVPSAGSTEWREQLAEGFHGSQPLDVENILKPTFDALAAGLCCEQKQDPRTIGRYDFDDSNFRYRFVQRLPDGARSRRKELLLSSAFARTPGRGV